MPGHDTAPTWRSPTDFTLEFVVVAETERWERVNPRQEFFRAPLKDIKHLMNNVAVAVADDEAEAAEPEPSGAGVS